MPKATPGAGAGPDQNFTMYAMMNSPVPPRWRRDPGLGLLLSEKAGQLAGVVPTDANPEAEALKTTLWQNMTK